MNDDFEERLQRRPLRQIPDGWRAEILQKSAKAKQHGPEVASFSLRQFLWSLRWHLVGMSAIWIVVVLLNLDTGYGSQLVAAVPSARIPSPQVILASLRENRRQLNQMTENQPKDAEERKALAPKPHSERPHEIICA